jgi:hypothetical protein
MNTLPKITLKVAVRNPDWVADRTDASNMDRYYIKVDRECEVLQLNLNAGTMRVRFRNPDVTMKKGFTNNTTDVAIAPFFEQYTIAKNV